MGLMHRQQAAGRSAVPVTSLASKMVVGMEVKSSFRGLDGGEKVVCPFP